MIRLAHRIARDERGASIVEMGFAAPILAMMLIGMVDLSQAYSMRLELEQAAQRTIEKVMQEQQMLTDYEDALKAEAAAAADVAEAAVTPDFYLECSTNGTSWSRAASFTAGCPAGTVYYARYVEVAITKNFEPTFNTEYFPGANSSGQVPLTGTAGLRIQ